MPSVVIHAAGVSYAGDDQGRIALLECGAAHFVRAHDAGVTRLALDAGCRLLASLDREGAMALWMIDDVHRLRRMARTRLPGAVRAHALAILDDGRVAAGLADGTLSVYDPMRDTWDFAQSTGDIPSHSTPALRAGALPPQPRVAY